MWFNLFKGNLYTALLTGSTSPRNNGCGSPNMGCVCFPAGLSWLCHLNVPPQMLGFGPHVDRGGKPSWWPGVCSPILCAAAPLQRSCLQVAAGSAFLCLESFPESIFTGPCGLGLDKSFMSMESPSILYITRLLQFCLPPIYFSYWRLFIVSILMLILEIAPSALFTSTLIICY